MIATDRILNSHSNVNSPIQSGLRLWLLGADYDQVNGVWLDRTTNHNDFTQTNSGLRPTKSGKSVVFDGINDFLQCANNVVDSEPKTVFITCKQVSATALRTMFCLRTSNPCQNFAEGSPTYQISYDGINSISSHVVNPRPVVTTSHISVFEDSAVGVRMAYRFNGAYQVVTSGVTTEQLGTTGSYIGRKPDASNYNGSIDAILVYNRILSLDEIINNEKYLANYSGITL